MALVEDQAKWYLLKELIDGAALLHGDAAAVAGAVPVGEGDVDRLLFDPPLVLLPLLPQVLPQLVLLLVLHISGMIINQQWIFDQGNVQYVRAACLIPCPHLEESLCRRQGSSRASSSRLTSRHPQVRPTK